ncbi:hypothetical protein GEOBRER4_n0548 [Citrifermentans bremense]|uniref:CheW-like domain-containing protein n=1 Tax=Citrifermentans bremense TaxID=60035 RepID=A0A6S6LWS6_9BACT|nr:hypothetical protein [Citrifermentans bremense]BCG45778.1 hypothetical protein GEOBRER4_n0548 [Citrifermentans bremense]
MTAGPQGYLNLLLFSVQGVRFGIEAEQALETALYSGEEAEDLFWLHELLQYRIPVSPYLAPAVVTVGARQGARRRVIIDGMEEIAEYAISDMRPLPAACEKLCLRNGIWGVLPRRGELTLLLDLLALFGRRDQEAPKPPQVDTDDTQGAMQQ